MVHFSVYRLQSQTVPMMPIKEEGGGIGWISISFIGNFHWLTCGFMVAFAFFVLGFGIVKLDLKTKSSSGVVSDF